LKFFYNDDFRGSLYFSKRLFIYPLVLNTFCGVQKQGETANHFLRVMWRAKCPSARRSVRESAESDDPFDSGHVMFVWDGPAPGPGPVGACLRRGARPASGQPMLGVEGHVSGAAAAGEDGGSRGLVGGRGDDVVDVEDRIGRVGQSVGHLGRTGDGDGGLGVGGELGLDDRDVVDERDVGDGLVGPAQVGREAFRTNETAVRDLADPAERVGRALGPVVAPGAHVVEHALDDDADAVVVAEGLDLGHVFVVQREEARAHVVQVEAVDALVREDVGVVLRLLVAEITAEDDVALERRPHEGVEDPELELARELGHEDGAVAAGRVAPERQAEQVVPAGEPGGRDAPLLHERALAVEIDVTDADPVDGQRDRQQVLRIFDQREQFRSRVERFLLHSRRFPFSPLIPLERDLLGWAFAA